MSLVDIPKYYLTVFISSAVKLGWSQSSEIHDAVTVGACEHCKATRRCFIISKDNGVQSNARILSGYNTVMGSILNLSYSDTAQISGAQYLYPGSMRFPGGGVANYWNFSNSSYVEPCSTPNYNECGHQQHINQWPLQTFSAKNFQNGISSASLLNESKICNAHSIVFDFNLLTLSGQEMLNQVDILKLQIDGDKLKYLELGNEYYISKKYNWSLPNSTYYMNKALPLIHKIKKEIPWTNCCV